jgi:hypothetical protein
MPTAFIPACAGMRSGDRPYEYGKRSGEPLRIRGNRRIAEWIPDFRLRRMRSGMTICNTNRKRLGGIAIVY